MNPEVLWARNPMNNVVNLNKFRKRKTEANAAKKADTNRRLHGRPNAERTREELLQKRLDSVLDGASMQSSEPDPESDD